jgi:hypothetical protein
MKGTIIDRRNQYGGIKIDGSTIRIESATVEN